MKRLVISLLVSLLIILLFCFLLQIQYYFNDFFKYCILFGAFCFIWFIVYLFFKESKL